MKLRLVIVLILLWLLVILLLTAWTRQAWAHQPVRPDPEELCAWLPVPDCVTRVTLALTDEDHLHASISASGPTSPIYRGMGTGAETWRPLVSEYWPADTIDRAICVIEWESGGNPDAKNPDSSARGLFQIMASVWAPTFGVSYDDLYDPDLNTRLAYRIYQIQGWGAWQAVNRGKC